MHQIQEKILELIESQDISGLGYRKIGELVGVDHPQKVKWHLSKLIKDSHVIRSSEGELRAAPKESSYSLAKVPILGMANCGEPLAYADNTLHGYLSISASLLPGAKSNIFAVQAKGDSMNKVSISGQNIEENDYVIIDTTTRDTANGDCILASIEGLATIKQFFKNEEHQIIALNSVSTRPRPPIYIDGNSADEALIVHGRAIKVIKAMQS